MELIYIAAAALFVLLVVFKVVSAGASADQKFDVRHAAEEIENESDDYQRDFYDVIMAGCGQNKILVIKVLRQELGLGLREAMMVSDRPGAVVVARAPVDKALRLKVELKKAGAELRLEAVD